MVKKSNDSWKRHWQLGLCTTCFTTPVQWLLAFLCPPCYSFCQRKKINPPEYICCGGAYGDCDCGGKSCPNCCLCLEVTFCCWCSIFGNRWLIQSQYGVQNTKFENCVMWTACICSWVWLIVRLVVNFPGEQLVDFVCDLIYCAFSACMQSQQNYELEYWQSGGPSDVSMKPY